MSLPCGSMGLYAAYGSNLDPQSMAIRARHSPVRGSGWLNGWRLTFSDQGEAGVLATLVEDEKHQVYVSLYDVTPGDEHLLDEWEGLSSGVSRKIRVRVQTLDGDELAWAHVLDAYEGGLPTAGYLLRLADAAEAGGAPPDYVAELRGRPCTTDDDGTFPPQET